MAQRTAVSEDSADLGLLGTQPHRITELLRLDMISGGHQVQPDAQSRVKESKLLSVEPRWVLEAYSESELSRAFPNAQSPSIPIICSKSDPGTM